MRQRPRNFPGRGLGLDWRLVAAKRQGLLFTAWVEGLGFDLDIELVWLLVLMSTLSHFVGKKLQRQNPRQLSKRTTCLGVGYRGRCGQFWLLMLVSLNPKP